MVNHAEAWANFQLQLAGYSSAEIHLDGCVETDPRPVKKTEIQNCRGADNLS